MNPAARPGVVRPVSWLVLLVLGTAVWGSWAIGPPAATANVCDAVRVGGVCGSQTGVGGVMDDVGGALGDAAGAVGQAAGAAGKWTGKHARGIVKVAAALGITVGTWVACSKVLKALTTAGAAVAATPETAGAGTVAGGMAGAAAAGAVCQLVRKGGKLILKVGKTAAKSGGKLAGIAKLAAGATALAALFYGTEHAAAWVLTNLLNLDARSAPNLDATWLTQLRGQLNGTAAVLLLLATILGLILAGVRGRVSDVGRIFAGMMSVALIIGVVGTLLLGALQLSDAVTAESLRSPWGQRALGNWKDLGDSYAHASPVRDTANAAKSAAAQVTGNGTPADDGKGPWIVRLLIAFFTAFCGALVKLELLIRDGLLYLLLAFGGLLLAGYPFPATRHLAQRFGMTLLGVVVAKPVIVITLLIGGTLMQSAAAGGTDDGVIIPLLQGAGLMALSAFLGWTILAWFSVHGVSMASGVSARIRGASLGGGSSSSGNASTTGPDPAGGTSGAGGPVGALAREAGDRVGVSDPQHPDAPGPAGSARLQQLQACEQPHHPNPAAQARTAAAAGGVGGSGAAAALSGAGASRQAGDPQAALATSSPAAPAAAAAIARAPSGLSDSQSVSDGVAPDTLPGGDAPAISGVTGTGGGSDQPLSPGLAPITAPAAAGGGVASGDQWAADSADASLVSPDGSRGDPQALVPASASSVSGSASPSGPADLGPAGFPDPSQAQSAAQAAFGAGPVDPVAAFGQHATAVNDLLAANRALGDEQ